MLEEEELLPPDPESPDSEASELDQIEGSSLRMTQAMNHYQWEEHRCFVCGVTDHFARDCLHWEAFCAWHREHLNSKGVGPKKKVPTQKSPPSVRSNLTMYLSDTPFHNMAAYTEAPPTREGICHV